MIKQPGLKKVKLDPCAESKDANVSAGEAGWLPALPFLLTSDLLIFGNILFSMEILF